MTMEDEMDDEMLDISNCSMTPWDQGIFDDGKSEGKDDAFGRNGCGQNATTTSWARRSPSSHNPGSYLNQLCDRTNRIVPRSRIPTSMRVGGFLITPSEARRWYSQQEPDRLASETRVITLLGQVVRRNHAKLYVINHPTQNDDDMMYLVPTRRAHFDRQMFRDIGCDGLRLEQCKWGEQEDIVHKLIKEHGLEAEFTTVYVEDSDWYKDPERSPSPPPPPFAQIEGQGQCLPPYPLHPSRPLVAMSIVSCFLAIAAFVSSLTGYDSVHPVVMPNTLGFLFTVPFHVHLYLSALTRTPRPFMGTHDIVYMFFLVSLWIWIFFMNVCSASSHRVGYILATVASGMAWPTLLFIALKSTSEVRRIHDAGLETDLSDSEGGESDETSAGAGGYPIPRPIRHHPPARTTEPQSLIFFASFVLCTITAMIFHYRCTFLAPLNVAAYLATAPHHIALFVSGRRGGGGGGGLARATPLPYACFLVSLWCCVFVLDVSHAARTKLFQKIVAGIFGGLECMVVVALAVRSVSDSLEEGPIKLV
ncbi:hypothetical protein FPV67DRAFT_1456630 [Lyophyllum atratum]|nr:hypothetical protein FPV67DRAFT_1456630 [Lyophyllum atratum]